MIKGIGITVQFTLAALELIEMFLCYQFIFTSLGASDNTFIDQFVDIGMNGILIDIAGFGNDFREMLFAGSDFIQQI